MRDFDALERGWQASVAPPRDRGTVRLVVARLGGGEHRELARGELDLEDGLRGDRWKDGASPSRGRQLTLMEARVAALVTDGQPLHLPGDNLLVELDLGVAAAPTGSRLRVGTALIEVTDKPHAGCKTFAARFGADALAWVNDARFAERRLRGINACVIEAGVVCPGDVIENLGL